MTRFCLANLFSIIFSLQYVGVFGQGGTSFSPPTDFTSMNLGGGSSVTSGAWTGSGGQSTASMILASMMSSSVVNTFPSAPGASSAAPTAISTATVASTILSTVPITSVSPITPRTRTYRFQITSNQTLKTGNITDATTLANITAFVRSSFSLTNGTTLANVTRAEIRTIAKATANSQLFTDILFNTPASCSDDCFSRTITPIPPTVSLALPAQDGTLVSVTANGAATLVTESPAPTTTPAPSYSAGEPPPGRAAQLGMGLGISFIAVLLIAEIVFLYKKYGCSPAARASDYELRYNQDYEGA